MNLWGQLFGFGLVLWRASAMLVAAPIWSARMVPARVRLAIAFWASFAAYSGAGAPVVAIPSELGGLAALAAGELAIGLAAALAARMVLEAAYAAGQTAALSLGLGFGALIDPSSGAESTVLGQLLSVLTLATAVGLGVHREALVWLARSLEASPPGGALELQTLLQGVITHAVYAVVLTIRLAYPLVAAATMGHIILGLMARTAPQLNLSTIGFSVAILCGGGALYLTAPELARLCAQATLDAWRSS